MGSRALLVAWPVFKGWTLFFTNRGSSFLSSILERGLSVTAPIPFSEHLPHSCPQLTIFIGIRSVSCVCSDEAIMEAVNMWPEDGWVGALQAIPIYICAFACHFNVLPVHGELAKPTRERLHRMVRWHVLSPVVQSIL